MDQSTLAHPTLSLAVQGLQGLAARSPPARAGAAPAGVFLLPAPGDSRTGAEAWLRALQTNGGATTLDTRFQSSGNVAGLVARLQQVHALPLAGYFLCDSGSITAALSMCATESGVPVMSGDESVLQAAGLSLLLDVRGMTDDVAWSKAANFTSHGVLVYQNPSKLQGGFLSDYAVFARAFTTFTNNDDVTKSAVVQLALKAMDPQFATLGWGNSEDGLVGRLHATGSG